jgi:hypothetical protein
MVALNSSAGYFFIMNSWSSKITISVALLTACGSLNSCRLFGGGKYASQTEIETEVPDSLDQGRPSTEPSAGSTASYATANGVPVSSNLIETTETIPLPGDLSPLPGSQPSSVTGGPALSSVPSDSSRALIDIPKPDFSSVSVHSPRPPAQMLTLDGPAKATPRMSAPASSLRPYTSGLAKETLQPSAPVVPASTSPSPSEAEIANAPKATSTDSDPGVPLLHSGARLSDFYAVLHQPLLDQTVVENTPIADPDMPPATDDSAGPPPPPGSEDFAAPKPQ